MSNRYTHEFCLKTSSFTIVSKSYQKPLGGAADGDLALSSTLVSLSRENLVVVGAELHAGSSPSIEELAGIDGAAGAVVVTDGPVLLEGLGAVD